MTIRSVGIIGAGFAGLSTAKVLRACQTGLVRTVEGEDLAIEFDSICLHSDTPGALDLVEATRKALDAAGIVVRAPR